MIKLFAVKSHFDTTAQLAGGVVVVDVGVGSLQELVGEFKSEIPNETADPNQDVHFRSVFGNTVDLDTEITIDLRGRVCESCCCHICLILWVV